MALQFRNIMAVSDETFETQNVESGADDRLVGLDWNDARKLIAERPLAWVSSPAHFEGSLLPLIATYDASGRPQELIGHFARRNALVPIVETDPRVNVLFTGPDSYISPRHAGRRDWGPTWNYAQLHIQGELIVEDGLTEAALEMLIDKVEAGADSPWGAQELGRRYEVLLAHIVGFRIRVEKVSGRFKLGQDEDLKDLQNILANLPAPDLVRWMRDANAERLETPGSQQ
jgi:transcriptional regulator|tara:strand:- start:42900 stop:43589 length:690 start_codon:yes stop_codon:yes gene_type:complete